MARVQVDLGAVLIAENQLEEGIRHLRRALELAPDMHEAYFNLGVAEFRRGNKPEALKCWLRTVELKPQNYEAHYNLALLLDEQGRRGPGHRALSPSRTTQAG